MEALALYHGVSIRSLCLKGFMNITNIHEAKTHLSRLVEEAAKGKEIIIGKAGKPLAKLVPFFQQKKPRKPGSLKGKIWIDKDFNKPLPPKILNSFPRSS